MPRRKVRRLNSGRGVRLARLPAMKNAAASATTARPVARRTSHRFRFPIPAARETDSADSPESASRSKAMSRADWNRSPGVFSRQWPTIRSRAGGRLRFVSDRSGGSSLRIAFMVSTAEAPRKARRPDSIS